MRGVVLGGTSSGVGKTVATLAMIVALEDAGYDVQPAKAGPDFIDPSHHAAVADRPSRTLDLWLQGTEGLRENYWRGEGDVCVVEGVMGLYDGDRSSTAMVAEALELPVVLVVDAAAGMESVAATALGFREYADRIGRDVEVVGVIAQHAHPGRHTEGVREAVPADIRFLGSIAPDGALEIPDRHLGLHMGDEAALDRDALATAAERIDPEAVVSVAREPPATRATHERAGTGRTVAVARDSAFAFSYPATMETLHDRAMVRTFSPVAGDDLPPADAVYIPGGYPETHAEAIAASPAIDAIADRAADGLPVFGECGGMMVLCESLTTADGETHRMAGVLPASVEMCDRYQALDHVALTARMDTPVADEAQTLRGHEFHYSRAEVANDARLAFDLDRGEGIAESSDGLLEHRTLGTYAHLHASSGAFDTLIEG
jgi:cobyrinic acid a,c-diamide synthase